MIIKLLSKLRVCQFSRLFWPIFGSKQLLLVTTPGWGETRGVLTLWERKRFTDAWSLNSHEIPVVVGNEGMGWGRGLHPDPEIMQVKKMEGDQRSPAGVFRLTKIFGLQSQKNHFKMPYLLLKEGVEAVDDPYSVYYNCIVDNQEVIQDWKTSEKMWKVDPQYRLGIVVEHNRGPVHPFLGSCIFIHIWSEDGRGTAGCTAMGGQDLHFLCSMLDDKKVPLLVQLPHSEYIQRVRDWHLPMKE